MQVNRNSAIHEEAKPTEPVHWSHVYGEREAPVTFPCSYAHGPGSWLWNYNGRKMHRWSLDHPRGTSDRTPGIWTVITDWNWDSALDSVSSSMALKSVGTELVKLKGKSTVSRRMRSTERRLVWAQNLWRSDAALLDTGSIKNELGGAVNRHWSNRACLRDVKWKEICTARCAVQKEWDEINEDMQRESLVRYKWRSEIESVECRKKKLTWMKYSVSFWQWWYMWKLYFDWNLLWTWGWGRTMVNWSWQRTVFWICRCVLRCGCRSLRTVSFSLTYAGRWCSFA